jgi:hypothetical protein
MMRRISFVVFRATFCGTTFYYCQCYILGHPFHLKSNLQFTKKKLIRFCYITLHWNHLSKDLKIIFDFLIFLSQRKISILSSSLFSGPTSKKKINTSYKMIIIGP